MLLYWRARRWTRCYFDKKPRWYRSNVLSSYNIEVAARDCVSRPRTDTWEIPRRVRFSGDISRRARREIDPDRIFDLDATRAMCCYGSLGGIPFTSPTIDNPRTIDARENCCSYDLPLRDSREEIGVSTFSTLFFQSLLQIIDEIVEIFWHSVILRIIEYNLAKQIKFRNEFNINTLMPVSTNAD